MKSAVKFIIFAGALAMVASCGNGNPTGNKEEAVAAVQQERIPNVSIMETSSQDVIQDEVYTSSVEAYAINNIAPQSLSRIQKIYVEVGDYVRKGQVVARMDEVSLNQTRLSMVNDSIEFSRLKGLYDEGGLSKSDLDAMELKYNVSRSQYENILENTVLRSPLNGVISQRNYDQGDMYSGEPIYVVEQITPVKLLVGISEADYTKIKQGNTVEITVDALPGKSFTGRISRIYPTIDLATHTFTAEVQVSNADRVLKPGMYARVKIVFGVNHSVVIPDNSIVKQPGSAVRTVFILQPDNTVKERVIKLGRHFDTYYEILEGLSDGEKLVVKGASSLKDGDKVNVQ